MATHTLASVNDKWADGTVVSVFARDAFGNATGSAVTTGTVTGGAVTFTGLADAANYVASQGGKAVFFRTPTPAAATSFATLADIDAATALVNGNDLYYDGSAALVKGHAPRIVVQAVGNLGAAKTVDLSQRVYSIFTCTVDQASCDLTISNGVAGSEYRLELTNPSGSSRTVNVLPSSPTVAVTVPANSTVTVVGSTPDGILYQHRQVGAASAAAGGTLVGYCVLTLSADAAISAGGTNVPWDSELADPQGMHAAGAAAAVTVPAAAGSAAIAHITAAVSIDVTSGTRTMVVRKNTTQIRPTNNSFITDSAVSRATSAFQVPCQAGDTFDVRVGGAAFNAKAGETLSVFSVSVFVSP